MWPRTCLILPPAFLLLACGGGREAAVRVGLFRGEELTPLTEKLGHFAAENVPVAVHELASSSKAMEAMLGGSLDVVAGGYDHAIRLAAEGRRTLSFFVISVRSPLALVVSPRAAGRRTVADLRGATIGVSALGSSGNHFLNLLLARAGLSAADVKIVATGGGHATTVAWAEQGRVDAIVTLPASLEMLRARHPDLVVLADGATAEGSRRIFGVEAYPAVCLISQERWLRENPEAARKLARAMLRTLGWVRSHPAEEFQQRLRGGGISPGEIEGLRATAAGCSTDGRMQQGGPEAVRDMLAAANPAIAAVDLRATFTEEFLP